MSAAPNTTLQYADGNLDNFDYAQLKDRSYKAHNYGVSKELEKGPLPQRKCTNLLCLIVFIAAVGAVLYMSIDGYVRGNPDEMLAPVSGAGQLCGYNIPAIGDATGYPKLYIPNLTAAAASPSNLFEYGVCVSACPKSATSTYNCLATP